MIYRNQLLDHSNQEPTTEILGNPFQYKSVPALQVKLYRGRCLDTLGQQIGPLNTFRACQARLNNLGAKLQYQLLPRLVQKEESRPVGLHQK